MITKDAVERAQQDVLDAKASLDKIEPRLLPSHEAGAVLAAARGRVTIAEARHIELSDQYDAEQAEMAARPDKERAAAKDIAHAERELQASRDRLAAAAGAAQRALVELMDAAEGHNERVRQVADLLATHGLRVDEGYDHTTAGALGRTPAARLKGTWWTSVEPSNVLAWVIHRVGLGRLASDNGITWYAGQLCNKLFDRRDDGLLAAVEAVSGSSNRPERVVLQRGGDVQGATVGLSEYDRKEQERIRDLQWVALPKSLAKLNGPVK